MAADAVRVAAIVQGAGRTRSEFRECVALFGRGADIDIEAIALDGSRHKAIVTYVAPGQSVVDAWSNLSRLMEGAALAAGHTPDALNGVVLVAAPIEREG